MQSTLRGLLAFASLLVPGRILVAQGADERPQEGHWSCFTAYDPGESIYVTSVWDGTALMQEVSNAYSGFLFTKYAYKDRVSCSRAIMSGSTVAKLTGDNESRNRQWAAAGKKIVQTGWTFDPVSARLPYLCAGYAQVRNAGVTKEYHFINKVLQMPGSTQGKLSLAWVDYLNKLNPGYYYQGPGCLLLPTEPTAQKQRIDAQIGMYAARKPEIVRTEWELPSQADVAETNARDDTPAYYCQMIRGDWKEWYVTAVYPVENTWTWEEYTLAWRKYAATLKLDQMGFSGGCDNGTMKQGVLARATRMQQIKGIAGSKIHEMDWRYAPR